MRFLFCLQKIFLKGSKIYKLIVLTVIDDFSRNNSFVLELKLELIEASYDKLFNLIESSEPSASSMMTSICGVKYLFIHMLCDPPYDLEEFLLGILNDDSVL